MANQVLTINSQSNTDGVYNHALINVSTDAGTPIPQTFNVGFLPRIVRVYDLTGMIMDTWFEGMAANSSVHQVGSTGVGTLGVTNGVTVNTTAGQWGSITLDAVTMAASSTFVIEAIG